MCVTTTQGRYRRTTCGATAHGRGGGSQEIHYEPVRMAALADQFYGDQEQHAASTQSGYFRYKNMSARPSCDAF